MKKLLLIGIPLLALLSCQNKGKTGTKQADVVSVENPYFKQLPETGDDMNGKQLSEIYCQMCHKYPEPDLWSKIYWEKQILPSMETFLGYYDSEFAQRAACAYDETSERLGLKEKREFSTDPEEVRQGLIEKNYGGRLVEGANIYPEKPIIAIEKLQKIRDYYLSAAPDEMVRNENLDIKVDLPRFKAYYAPSSMKPPMTSLTRIDEEMSQYIIADHKFDKSQMVFFQRNGKEIDRMVVPQAVVDMYNNKNGLFITSMGQLFPTDDPLGKVSFMYKTPGQDKYTGITTILDSLQRPVCTRIADFNNDGNPDFLICQYGHRTGRLSLFTNQGERKFKETILRKIPGAIMAYVNDLNGDGLPDVAALFAQGDESLFYYYNNGDGTFEEDRVLRFPPAWGSNFFEMVDYNKDGFLDIVHVAGDNADFSEAPKPYHGVRIYLNDGKNKFEEYKFFPIYGAYRSACEDFDLDGDLDFAAISYFPDYFNHSKESFVYLENDGNDNFKAMTFPQHLEGRWITFDIGDLDKDGDKDIILGSYSIMIPNQQDQLANHWMQNGPSYLLLRNMTK